VRRVVMIKLNHLKRSHLHSPILSLLHKSGVVDTCERRKLPIVLGLPVSTEEEHPLSIYGHKKICIAVITTRVPTDHEAENRVDYDE